MGLISFRWPPHTINFFVIVVLTMEVNPLFDRRSWRSIQVVNVNGDSVLMLIIVLFEIAARTRLLLANRPAASLMIPIVRAFQFSARRVSIVAILTAVIACRGQI